MSDIPDGYMTFKIEEQPVRNGAILFRLHEEEPAPKIVEVTERWREIDSDRLLYTLWDPTHTVRTVDRRLNQSDLVATSFAKGEDDGGPE